MKQSKKKLFLLLLISGIIFLCAGIFLSSRTTEFQREGIKTNAEIVVIDRAYDSNDKEEASVYVKYTVGDTVYTRELDYYSSNLYIGQSVPIYYLPDNPARISYAKAQFLPPVLFYVGAGVCLAFGAYIAVTNGFKFGVDRLEKLKENGKRITAKIKGFDYKKNTRLLGKHPATLFCVDSFGNSYQTKFFYKNGQTVNVGDTITVYVDKKNEEKYVIDLQEYLTRERDSDSVEA